MASLRKIARRTFLFGAAAVVGGVAVGTWYYKRPYANPLANGLAEGEATFNPFVKIASDNTITIIAPRAEMGQGIATSWAALVAEELDVDLAQVKVEHGVASFAYYNEAIGEEGAGFPFFAEGMLVDTLRSAMGVTTKMLGLQGTGGSSSARDGFVRMREAGAAVRLMLLGAAAARLGVPAGELETASATITHKASGRSLSYGDVALEAAKSEPPAEVVLRDRKDWKIVGKPQKRVDMLAKVTGAPIYGIDVRLPDMLYGTVLMSPRFWAKPVKSDLSKAEKIPGVIKIVPIETSYGGGFGIIAENTWAAFKGAEAIEVEWGAAEEPADSAAIDTVLLDTLASGGGWALRNDGDVDTAFADAPRERLVEADYAAPYLAHTCMEPMNATAWAKGDTIELWSPNQMPTVTRYFCADLAGIERDKLTVHTPMMGGGFGRRIELDFSMYAVLLAKETGGRPIKVTWTREEDTRHDAYRPAARARFQARLGDDGLPVALDMKIASQSLTVSMMRRLFPSLPAGGPDPAITQGAADQPYAIPSYRVTGIAASAGVPIGSWRSVGNSFNGFFHEGFMDEVAVAAKLDPIEMRRKLMAPYPAAVAVLDKVAAMSGWGEPLPTGKARGVAFTLSFGSWVAEVIEIADTPAGIRVEKVWIAADVGTAIDPGIIEAQLVSAAIYGLSAAISQEITIADGGAEQSNFHDFDAMRIFQCPVFEVAILENFHRMGGVGEIGTPPAAPALANAVFALTGKRIRALPLNREVAFA